MLYNLEFKFSIFNIIIESRKVLRSYFFPNLFWVFRIRQPRLDFFFISREGLFACRYVKLILELNLILIYSLSEMLFHRLLKLKLESLEFFKVFYRLILIFSSDIVADFYRIFMIIQPSIDLIFVRIECLLDSWKSI